MNNAHLTSRFSLPLLALGLMASATAVHAQAKDSDYLTSDRVYDYSYGMSLLLPLDCATQRSIGDQYKIRIADKKGRYTMFLAVKKSRRVLTLRQVAKLAKEQVRKTQPTATTLKDPDGTPPSKMTWTRTTRLASRPAEFQYYRMPQATGAKLAFTAQAIIEIDPLTFAVLKMTARNKDVEQTKPIFEAVARSLRIEDQRKLNAMRRKEVDAAVAWRERVSLKDLHKTVSLIPKQHFKIVEGKKIVGTMTMIQNRIREQNKPGIGVQLRVRIIGGKNHEFYFDSISTFFLADDDSLEIWSTKVTRRSVNPASRKRTERKSPRSVNPTNTVVQTAIRTGDLIKIYNSGTRNKGERQLDIPRIRYKFMTEAEAKKRGYVGVKPRIQTEENKGKVRVTLKHAYLSQVESFLLAQILPHDRAGTYGFYYYYPHVGAVTYRTDKIVPGLDGFKVYTKLAPNAPTLKSSYDPEGRLVERELSDKQRIVPTTEEVTQKFWRQN